jgi:hypothetical protein
MKLAGASLGMAATRAAWAAGLALPCSIPAASSWARVRSKPPAWAPVAQMIPCSAGHLALTSRILAACSSVSQKISLAPESARMYWHSCGRFDW